MRTFALGMVVVLLACVGVSAHDFWLSANPARPADGRVTITANVGDHFPKSTSFTAPERVEQWRIIGAGGEVTVARDFRRIEETVKEKLVPTALATDVSLPSAGAYLGVMTIAARTSPMKGPEFTDYLKEEGLDQIIAARQAAGDADKAVKETYARYAKIAIRNGEGSGAHLTRPVGLKAEFIPSSDPTSVKVGQALRVQLIADGKPVANAAVTAVSHIEGPAVKGRTDAKGHVTLKIDREGPWLIKTVHMAKSSTPEVDWESFWVTLVFQTAR